MTATYEDAYRRDIEPILERIPANDLAIQIDYCTEIRDILDAFPWSPHREGKFEMWMDAVVRQATGEISCRFETLKIVTGGNLVASTRAH